MLANDYPLPSYVHLESPRTDSGTSKPVEGWVEMPLPETNMELDQARPQEKAKAKVYAIDCEMVRMPFVSQLFFDLALTLTVYDRRWEGVDSCMYDRL